MAKKIGHETNTPTGMKQDYDTAIKVDLHLHSSISDGYYTPAELAEALAAEGVKYAALTDHHSAAGLAAFQETAVRLGITPINGAEVHALFNGTEIHLLAYGFTLSHPEIKEVLDSLHHPDNAADHESDYAAGLWEARKVIKAVHRAGGLLFLAHPLQYGHDEEACTSMIKALAGLGIDGIEAFYKAYPPAAQEMLAALADRLGLLCCGGSDFHGPAPRASEKHLHIPHPEITSPGISVPARYWKVFRGALALNNHSPAESEKGAEKKKNTEPENPPEFPDTSELSRPSELQNAQVSPELRGSPESQKQPEPPEPNKKMETHFDWSKVFLRIVLPSLLVIGFFIMLIFSVLLPTMEELLLDRKRETAVELTNSAWSILSDYHREVTEGAMDMETAQQTALERIRRMRYGPEGLDYFWITDTRPVMIMHPYRPDLEGKDVSDVTDPHGIRPFIEFAAAVREHSSGFVRYVWQWQDDPDRLEPKESYVRGFEPWDWIIGTGLYVDDVSREINNLTRRMVDVSFLVTLISAGLLILIAFQSIKAERIRGRAVHDLQLSHERYQALVESSSGGTLLITEGRCSYANAKLLEMTGYNAREIALLDSDDILQPPMNGNKNPAEKTREQHGELGIYETKLKRKNGQTIPVLVSSTPVYFSGQQGLLLTIQDLSRHRSLQSEAARDYLITQLQTSLLYLTEPVKNSMDKPVSCSLNTTVKSAARIMNRHSAEAVAVLGPDNELVGIVSDHDIRSRVVGTGLSGDTPVSKIMSAPVITVHEDSPVFEALILEQEQNIDHVAVTDGKGKLTGIIRSSRANRPERHSLIVLTHQIQHTVSPDEIKEHWERLPLLVGSLLDSGAPAQNICQVTTAVSDAVVRRVLELTLPDMEQEAGPPPGPFAFILLGSEARKEQTLVTDQDNALIYELPDNAAAAETEHAVEYFLKLGEKICGTLNAIGLKYCPGGNMAQDPGCCRPLDQWKASFTRWITEPDQQALSRCNVFFDLRHLYGDPSLTARLQEHIRSGIGENPGFLAHMALNTLHYTPPVGIFGQILTGTSGEPRNTFNIKEAMLPIINFARLYTYRHHLEETNTLSRLEQLNKLGLLQDDTFRNTFQAYEHLTKLRFQHQVQAIKNSLPPDNSIDPDSLTGLELGMVKQVFAQISLIQKKVRFDYHTHNLE